MNSAKPEEGLKVELYVDDKLIETLPAQTVRQDLTNKVGTGRYGFSFKIPASYKDEKQHEIHVKVVGENYTVPFFEGVFSNFVCKP